MLRSKKYKIRDAQTGGTQTPSSSTPVQPNAKCAIVPKVPMEFIALGFLVGVFLGFWSDFGSAVCCAQGCAIDGSVGWKLQSPSLLNNNPGLGSLLLLVPVEVANLRSLISADVLTNLTPVCYLVPNDSPNVSPGIYSGQKGQGSSLQINCCF